MIFNRIMVNLMVNNKRLEFEERANQNGEIHFSLKFPNCDQFYEFTAKEDKKGRWELWYISGSGDYRKMIGEENCAWDTVGKAKKQLYAKLELMFY